MAINSSIKYQIEFLRSRRWLANGEFAGLARGDVDPIAGEPRERIALHSVTECRAEECVRPAALYRAARRRLFLHPERDGAHPASGADQTDPRGLYRRARLNC